MTDRDTKSHSLDTPRRHPPPGAAFLWHEPDPGVEPAATPAGAERGGGGPPSPRDGGNGIRGPRIPAPRHGS